MCVVKLFCWPLIREASRMFVLYIFYGRLMVSITGVGSQVVDGLMQILWGILDMEQLNTQTLNNIVISSVELIYCYAECLALHGPDTGRHSVAPAVVLFKKLLFSSSEGVQTSSRFFFFNFILILQFYSKVFTHNSIPFSSFQLGYIFKVASGPISKANNVSY